MPRCPLSCLAPRGTEDSSRLAILRETWRRNGSGNAASSSAAGSSNSTVHGIAEPLHYLVEGDGTTAGGTAPQHHNGVGFILSDGSGVAAPPGRRGALLRHDSSLPLIQLHGRKRQPASQASQSSPARRSRVGGWRPTFFMGALLSGRPPRDAAVTGDRPGPYRSVSWWLEAVRGVAFAGWVQLPITDIMSTSACHKKRACPGDWHSPSRPKGRYALETD